MPVSILIVVDFPAPFGPIKATRSPLRVSVGELRNDTGCDSDGNLDPGDTAQVPVTVRNVEPALRHNILKLSGKSLDELHAGERVA